MSTRRGRLHPHVIKQCPQFLVHVWADPERLPPSVVGRRRLTLADKHIPQRSDILEGVVQRVPKTGIAALARFHRSGQFGDRLFLPIGPLLERGDPALVPLRVLGAPFPLVLGFGLVIADERRLRLPTLTEQPGHDAAVCDGDDSRRDREQPSVPQVLREGVDYLRHRAPRNIAQT